MYTYCSVSQNLRNCNGGSYTGNRTSATLLHCHKENNRVNSLLYLNENSLVGAQTVQ